MLGVGGGASGVAAAATAPRAGISVGVIEGYGLAEEDVVAGLSGTVIGLCASLVQPLPKSVEHEQSSARVVTNLFQPSQDGYDTIALPCHFLWLRIKVGRHHEWFRKAQ